MKIHITADFVYCIGRRLGPAVDGLSIHKHSVHINGNGQLEDTVGTR